MSDLGVNKAIFDRYTEVIDLAKEAFKDTCIANGCQSFASCKMCNKLDFFAIRLEKRILKDLINNR